MLRINILQKSKKWKTLESHEKTVLIKDLKKEKETNKLIETFQNWNIIDSILQNVSENQNLSSEEIGSVLVKARFFDHNIKHLNDVWIETVSFVQMYSKSSLYWRKEKTSEAICFVQKTTRLNNRQKIQTNLVQQK